jgi:hypothetical protein
MKNKNKIPTWSVCNGVSWLCMSKRDTGSAFLGLGWLYVSKRGVCTDIDHYRRFMCPFLSYTVNWQQGRRFLCKKTYSLPVILSKDVTTNLHTSNLFSRGKWISLLVTDIDRIYHSVTDKFVTGSHNHST